MIILFPSSNVIYAYNDKAEKVCLTACVCQIEHDFSEQNMIVLNHTLTKLKTQCFAALLLLSFSKCFSN